MPCFTKNPCLPFFESNKNILLLFLFSIALSASTQAQTLATKNVDSPPPSVEAKHIWRTKVFDNKCFVEQLGQYKAEDIDGRKDVRFAANFHGTEVFFSPQGLSYRIEVVEKKYPKKDHGAPEINDDELEDEREEELNKALLLKRHFVHLTWLGANPHPEIITQNPHTEVFHFMDKVAPVENSVYGARAYGKIIYKDLYPKIDLVYEFHEKEGLKYSFVLHPGADASLIKMQYEGATDLRLDEKGNVRIQTPYGEIRDHAPSTFYAKGNAAITSRFMLNKTQVSFELGKYNNSKTVIIDPWNVVPTTLLADLKAFDVATDNAGNVYVFGGLSPYKLAKYSPTGTLLWTFNSTYDATTTFGDLAVEPNGNCYIMNGFATTGGIQRTKVSTAGVAIWSVNGGMFEHFNMGLSCDNSKLVIGGRVGSGDMGWINMNTGALSGLTNVSAGGEIRSICFAQNGKIFGLTCHLFGAVNGNHLVARTNTLGAIFATPTGYNLLENGAAYTNGNTVFGPGWAGQNGVTTDHCYVYTTNGIMAQKRSQTTGAIIASAVAPGGVQELNSGIAVDNCGNVYVGSQGGLYKYDANMIQVSNYVTGGAVYCVTIGNNSELLICGNGFLASVDMQMCPKVACGNSVPTLAVTSTSAGCGVNNGTATATVTGGVAPISYNWSNGQITSTAINLAPGVYTVNVTSACNTLTATVTVGATAMSSAAFSYPDSIYCASAADPSPTIAGTPGGSFSASPAGLVFISANTGQVDLSASTPNNYTITYNTGGGCPNSSTVPFTVLPDATLNLTSGAGSNTQSFCLGTTLSPIAYAIGGGGTGASISGLPAGVSGSYTSGSYSITGTPSVSGTFNYTLTTTGSCQQTSATGSITVSPPPVINSIPFTNETSCGAANGTITINASGNGLTYSINGGSTYTASNIFTGLAAGSYPIVVKNAAGCTVNGGTISISSIGAPPAPTANANPNPLCAGGNLTLSVATSNVGETYNWTGPNSYAATGSPVTINNIAANQSGQYTVTATVGSCVSSGGSVTVTVNPNAAITLTSGPSSSAQIICANANMQTITYVLSGGATGAIVNGIPPGIISSISNGVVTISGSSSSIGTFNYTVTTTGTCAQTSATGTITINTNAGIALSSAPGTNAQTLCSNTAATPIVYTLTGGASGATVTGLPAGLSGAYSGGQFTISGSPTATGTFNYTVNTTGTCTQTSATGSLVVNPGPNIALFSPAGSDNQSICVNSSLGALTYSITGTGNGASASGLPNGVTGTYAAGVFNISGMPTLAGTYNYTITVTSTCGPTSTTGTITVNPNASIALFSAPGTDAQALCDNGLFENIVYTIAGGGTGATVSGLPSGVTGTFSAGNFTITGYPQAAGIYNYSVTTTGTCAQTAASGSISKGPAPTAQITGILSFCADQSTELNGQTSTAGSGAILNSFQWMKDGILLNGAMDSVFWANQAGAYTLIVTNDFGCVDTSNVSTVTLEPTPTVLVNIDSICRGETATLLATPSSMGGTYLWTPGGGQSQSISVAPTSNTNYNVAYTLGNCTGLGNGSVVVHPLPQASFAVPGQLSALQLQVNFYNTTAAATNYFWDFGDGTQATTTHPSHTYPLPGIYLVSMVAENAFGCRDTIFQNIEFKEEFTFYIPNTFTPDANEFNNGFRPIGAEDVALEHYHFVVYNRWGELVFESKDAKLSWDGTYGGQACPVGSYVWHLDYKSDLDDAKQALTGKVHLMR